jgi:hypothetical protein
MFFSFIWYTGILVLISQVRNLISILLALELLYISLILFRGVGGSGFGYIRSLVLVVGGAVLGLCLLVSVTTLYGVDTQLRFLD